MPVIRLTDEQRQQAEDLVEPAERVAKRFRPPPGMSREEWGSEVMCLMVQTVANIRQGVNFEAVLYMRARWHRLDLLRKVARQPQQLQYDDQIPAREPQRYGMEDVLPGLDPMESDVLRLRCAGGDWETIGRIYGVCGRTIRRKYQAVVAKVREKVTA